ncbi:MAG: phosphoribosylaminoimidazolecarboxamide formyltransferase/IMP cyclohydrolase [Planctomycetota bacterium]|jgi:phosphoribosylaminoimidazolecarboxamide formyltransferase/IMP cyclohydrolase
MTRNVRRALLSVSDKRGLTAFARRLSELGVDLIATGGTRALLEKEGISTSEVAEVTGSPEMMDGRVKTLHPKIHGGILALRDNADHVEAMGANGIEGIDLVVVNLYPFEETAAKPGIERADVVEQIDIGGPSMVRSAAKNHAFVGIVSDPDDYPRVLEELEGQGGSLSTEFRRELARKAFALTARYDAAISAWFLSQDAGDAPAFPDAFTRGGAKLSDLRYGENPHQRAAFYAGTDCAPPSLAAAEFLGGKELSYNNLVDLDAALALACEFMEPFVCVVKHNNPCGAAVGEDLASALERAWAGDPLSAFGSVLAMNRRVDLASAEFLVSENRFVEAIVAPGFDDDAFERLRTGAKWGKNVRLLSTGSDFVVDASRDHFEVKALLGGFLVQTADRAVEDAGGLTQKSKRAPSATEIEGLVFANIIAKHVRSNAIVLTQGRQVVGVGAGQMSRVDSVKIAVDKAGDRVQGSALGSDAFFPFPDGVETAMEAGVSAILQPGGSIRDQAVIDAVDACDAAMVFTGVRHFRH